MTLLYLFISIFGFVLGSFYNVVGLRIPQNQSFIYPRSSCPNCNQQLSKAELIPVLSYLFQKGKCKTCKCSISPLYPTIELLTAGLFTLSPLVLGWSTELIVSWTLISLLMIIIVSDLCFMLIPDKVLLFFGTLILFERFVIPLEPWWDMLIGSAVAFILLLAIALISKGGMGGGDIKLFAVLGLALGLKLIVVSFLFATIFGSIFGLIGMLLGKVERGKPTPFGPAIAAGTLTSYFFGQEFIDWYFSLFLFF